MSQVIHANPPVPRNIQEKISAARDKQNEARKRIWQESCISTTPTTNRIGRAIYKQSKAKHKYQNSLLNGV